MSLAALKSKLNTRKAEAAAKKAQFIRPHRFQTGKNRVRILPGWDKATPETFYQDFGMHFVKDKEGKLSAVYVCTDKTYGKECPVCSAVYEGIRMSKDTGNAGMEKLLGQARASARVLVNALVRDGDEPEKPVILELPAGVFDSMVDQMMTFADDDVDVLSTTDGHDFIVTKSGSGIDTEYSVALAPKATAVKYDETAVTDLTAYVSQESEQGLLKATGAVTAVTGLPAPASVARIGHESKTTGTDDRSAGSFITPPASGAAAAAAPAAAPAAAAAATGAAAILNTAAAAAEEELDGLEGELVGDDVPEWEEEAPAAEVAKPAPAPAPAPSEDDLAAEIAEASGDDLDDILNGLDDL